jgi:GntR family transcriptional regulator, arabinose operon transcriptional repressor
MALVLDELSPVGRSLPKYEQLRAKLIGEVTSGRLRPGDVLPPEPVIAEQMNVARSTVRQALAQMEQNGLVRRVRGKGTFIHEDAHVRLRSGLDAFALVLPDTQKGYYPSLLAGFEAASGRVRSQVLVINTRNDSHRQADGILQLIDKKVAGAAIVPAMSPPTPAYQIRQLQQHQIPVVMCHRGVEGVRAPLLAFSGEQVGRLAADAMCKKGHREVAFISTWRTDLAARYEAGLRTALQERGAALPDSRVIYLESDAYTDQQQYELRLDETLGQLLDQPRRPTALFATFDDVTELMFLQLMRRGVKVPHDVSLVSFGGATRIGAMQQQLTAVTVDETKLGELAAGLLNDMRSGKKQIESEERIEIPLGISAGMTLSQIKS